ncbi:MAG: ribonuclease E [Alphaproteobacteria bacterium]|nr:MAG: ribonuclease E [Alphaproteobacteria bacterium]
MTMDILIEELETSIWTIALDNGRLEGIEIDSPYEAVRWGSIYWAKVTRIDASLDAAFLDLDGDNSGILYNRDVRYKGKDGEICKGGDKAIGKILKSGDMIAVQAKSAYTPVADGDIWQNKEDKTTQMSMDITIPGRYLIYCALGQRNRISSRIRDKNLRKQLESMVNTLEGMNGFILRNAAADLQTDILKREANVLKEMWTQISAYFKGSDPGLIALGPDSIQRTLSDQAINPIERIEVVTMEHFTQAEEWCSIFAPDLMTKITPIELNDATQDLALLEHRDVLGQVESLLHDYAFLTQGGNIIIQETAALTAIDVNKGSDTRSHLALNIDAAREIGRQIRLRNIGGIIMVDFLKMNKTDEKKLLKELDNVINQDPCTIQIHGLTKLGLMEITRKRRTPPLHERFDGLDF